MISKRGVVEIVHADEDVELSLPMWCLEKIETDFGIGIPKLLIQIQANELTLTQAVTVIKIASQKELSRKQVQAWCDENGVLSLIKTVQELFEATFSTDEDKDEDGDSGKK